MSRRAPGRRSGDLARLVRDALGLVADGVAARFDRPIFGDADPSRCDATCCRGGVAVSTAERDAILRRAGAVREAMRESPRRGVPARGTRWFGRREKRDPDFRGGRSVDTRVVAGACVFLRADGLCAVHAASARALGHPYRLKPAYCILFPACVEGGLLDVCRGSYTNRPDCCSPVRRGRWTPSRIFAPTARVLRALRGRRRA